MFTIILLTVVCTAAGLTAGALITYFALRGDYAAGMRDATKPQDPLPDTSQDTQVYDYPAETLDGQRETEEQGEAEAERFIADLHAQEIPWIERQFRGIIDMDRQYYATQGPFMQAHREDVALIDDWIRAGMNGRIP